MKPQAHPHLLTKPTSHPSNTQAGNDSRTESNSATARAKSRATLRAAAKAATANNRTSRVKTVNRATRANPYANRQRDGNGSSGGGSGGGGGGSNCESGGGMSATTDNTARGEGRACTQKRTSTIERV